MERMEIAGKVNRILVEHLGRDYSEVTPNARLIEDLGADSLDMVELVMVAEEEFSIEVSDDEAEKWLTVIQCVDGIQSKLEAHL